MKIKVSELKKLVQESVRRQLSENIASDLLPGSEGKLAAYSAKVEKFIDQTIKEASDLADEGEALMRSDFTRENPSVGERNRFFLTLIGYLRKLQNTMAMANLELRKMIG